MLAQVDGYDQLQGFDFAGYRARYGNIRRLDRLLYRGGAEQHRRGEGLAAGDRRYDNGWSYQPTIDGLADHLAAVRVSQRYENVLTPHQDHAEPHAANRPAALRDAGRDQEERHGRAATPVPFGDLG